MSDPNADEDGAHDYEYDGVEDDNNNDTGDNVNDLSGGDDNNDGNNYENNDDNNDGGDHVQDNGDNEEENGNDDSTNNASILHASRPLTQDTVHQVASFFSSQFDHHKHAIDYLKRVIDSLEYAADERYEDADAEDGEDSRQVRARHNDGEYDEDSNGQRGRGRDAADLPAATGVKRARTGESLDVKEARPKPLTPAASDAADMGDTICTLPDNLFRDDALDAAPMTLAVLLPDDVKLISHIIGKGGASINAINSSTGCKVHVERKGTRPQEQYRYLYFQGSIRSIMEAFAQVLPVILNADNS
jgi:hypothetical protein